MPIIKRPGTLKGKTISPREFVEAYDIDNVVCCFSGGKDSLVATHLMLESLRDLNPPSKYVLFADTTVMIPIARPFVEEISRRFGWDLTVVSPRESFWIQAAKKGSPTMHRRWCCWGLKLEPIFGFVASLSGTTCQVTGMRQKESSRRKDFPQVYWQKRTRSWNYHPLIDWTEEHVDEYIREHHLPRPPWYDLGVKETCACGAFSSIKEIRKICELWPSFFKQYVELERNYRGGCFFYLRCRPYSAREIWEEVWGKNADNQSRA